MLKLEKPADGALGSLGEADRNPKRWPNAWRWTERMLLVSGLALLIVYSATRIESILASRAALARFASLDSSAATTSPNARNNVDLSAVDFRLWDGHRIRAYQESLTKEQGAPLGVLRIPKIHLEVPLLDGTDDLTLNHAVGRIAGTARPRERGNVGIAGHRDGFFRGLKDVGNGDEIELETPEGRDTYVVDQIKIVMPNDVDVLQRRSTSSLTLVTCYPFYFIGGAPQRYIVMASLTRETKSGLGKSDTPSVITNDN